MKPNKLEELRWRLERITMTWSEVCEAHKSGVRSDMINSLLRLRNCTCVVDSYVDELISEGDL